MTRTGRILSNGLFTRVVAGAAFGHYIGHLLYYLNPQIEITTPRLLAITTLYALIGGLLFGSALWAMHLLRLHWFGSGLGQSSGIGWIVFFCAFTTAVYLRHRLTLRIYLPRPSVNMLASATRVIAIATLVLFILWLAERTRGLSKVVPVAGIGLILLSSFFLFQRRDVYRVDAREPVVVNVEPVEKDHPLVLVTIDSLPHDWLVTLDGEMNLPWIERAREKGFFSRIEPFQTTNVRTIWASLATGKLPYRHGVTGNFSYSTPINRSTEPFLLLPRGVGFGQWALLPPVRKSSAHLPTGDAFGIWNVIDRLGLQAIVVNFPELSAATPDSNLVIVTDRQVAESSPAALMPIVLDDPTFESTRDRPSGRALLHDLRSASIATAAAGDSLSLVCVNLDGFGRIYDSLGIRGNALPDPSTEAGTAFRRHLVALDQILEGIEATFPNGLIAVVSPSAFEPRMIPHDMTDLALDALTGPKEGEVDGFLLMLGAEIEPGTTRAAVEISDIVPTLLFSDGLPTGRDMDGRVITEAFEDEVLRSTPLTVIQSYEAEQLFVRRPE